MRELVESVFIIKNSLAQSWNAFVLKYAANCSSIGSHKSAQEQQAEQVAWGRKKRRNKNVCIMIIATINWVQHKAYLQHVAAKQMTRKIAFNFCCLFFLSSLLSFFLMFQKHCTLSTEHLQVYHTLHALLQTTKNGGQRVAVFFSCRAICWQFPLHSVAFMALIKFIWTYLIIIIKTTTTANGSCCRVEKMVC